VPCPSSGSDCKKNLILQCHVYFVRRYSNKLCKIRGRVLHDSFINFPPENQVCHGHTWGIQIGFQVV
jgi:hypothetical protein